MNHNAESIVPVENYKPSNEFEKQFIDYFKEQIAGIVFGIKFDGYSPDKEVILLHHTPIRLFQAIERLLGDKNRYFYVRANGCYEQERYVPTMGSKKLHRANTYRIRIFLE